MSWQGKNPLIHHKVDLVIANDAPSHHISLTIDCHHFRPLSPAYVDTNLIGSGKVTQAAIVGTQGGVWATSAGFTLSQEEQNAIVGAWNNLDGVQGSGVKLASTKYFTLQATPEHIYGKKGADGCVIVKTKQAILVTVYKDPIQAPEATKIVEGLGDYLRGVGY